MWCPVVLLGAVFLLPALAQDLPSANAPAPSEASLQRSKRLTAFGKTPTGETEPKTPRGKECRTDDDCAALEFTLCKPDTDERTRCLCHDLQPPANGECATKRRDARGYVLIGNRRPPKELHQNCNYDHECITGAECIVNATIKVNEKRCYCRFGYLEEDNACNHGYRLQGLITLLLLALLALLTSHQF